MEKKLIYVRPEIEVDTVELEQGIANGSASVKPQTPGDVEQEWEIDDDVNHGFDWDWSE